jgi:NitT/TauT family transport system permease protein
MRLINRRPSRLTQLVLGLLPFVFLAVAYGLGSAARLAENPSDKLLPALSAIVDAVNRLAFVADPRTGEFILWADTLASLSRLGWALAIATAIALVLGMLVGMVPYLRALLAPFLAAVSMVPPLALLPILFIVLGLGETSKITLIVIGVAPIMVRDLLLRVLELPREQIVKAETLGGNSWQIGIRVVLPQVLPRLIDALRLQLGPAFLFLIAAEAISADAGLGYRIFLVRRYLAMDVIFPYVIWITLLAVLANLLLDRLRAIAFPWSDLGKAS